MRTCIPATLLASALALISAASSARAQELLGVLAEVTKPEIREQLQLSEEQVASLDQLQSQRMKAALDLGSAIREAPLDQRLQLRAEFGSETERLVFDVLNPEQRSQLAKMRIAWKGMLSLADAEVAEALNLADWQKDIVADWVGRVHSSRSSDRLRAQEEAQRGIRTEISNSQWAAWQLLAGQIAASEAGPPMPPERAPAPELNGPSTAGAVGQVVLENSEIAVEDIRLTLNFQNEPWKDVIEWLAEQADLSLQNDIIPPGSFKYRDRSRTYSVTETLDVMNATLLDKGYTLFRQNRMLRCIDFESEDIAPETIRAMVDNVSLAELETRGKYEPVSIIFTLERLDTEEVKTDIEQLLSIQGTVVALPLSGQLKVTDMAGNVRSIAKMIERAEDPQSARGSSIQSWELKHITADEVLDVARPLLGLEEGSNTSEEISISTGTFGGTIYAKGDSAKIQNLKDVITQMDVKPVDDGTGPGTVILPELKRHQVVGIELQLAYDIVSQMLAGAPGVRLAQNASSNQLILEARPAEHDLVAKALRELAGEASGFKVLQLKNLDTQLAIAAIKKFFNLTDTAAEGGPVIDGDVIARQVWVKGSATQIDQIEQLLATLENNASTSDLNGIQVYPGLKGDALEQVKALWEMRNGNVNPIQVIGPPGSRSSGGPGLPSKSFSPNSTPAQGDAAATGTSIRLNNRRGDGDRVPLGKLTLFPQEESSASDTAGQVGSFGTEVQSQATGSPITIMEGPNGLIIASDDPKALAEFDNLLRMVTDAANMSSSEPTVIYVTNIKATAAKELLETILSGTSSSSSGGGGLLGDMAGAMFGGGLGALLGGGGGDLLSSTSGIASGDYSITADPRLNCLIVKASSSDMRLIEQLMTVIDQVESPYSIETRGQIELIPVVTQDVTQVLNTIKGLYGDRIEGASGGGGSRGGGGGGGQPDPAAIIAALRGGGGGRGGGGNSSELAEPKISLAADTNTNMLIVMAQPQQIAELKTLVAFLEEAGKASEESIDYATLDGLVNAAVFEASIGRILGPKAQTNTSSSGSGGSSNSGAGGGGGGGGDDAATQARRQAFFDALRSGGGFGGTRGGTPSGFGGSRGGTPGGGGFGGFGGGRGGTPGGGGGTQGGGGRGGR